MGPLLNLYLRVSIAYFLVEVLRHPSDARFAGKAIPLRNLLAVGGLSVLFPVLHRIGKRWGWVRWDRYPWWTDNMYLSIFWLDMAGNSFDLYDRYRYFDLIPHTHGAGAIALVAQQAFGLPGSGAVGVANVIHILLEAQEYYTDVFAGTHNVRGTWDTVNDLLVGVVGSVGYVAGSALLRRGESSRT